MDSPAIETGAGLGLQPAGTRLSVSFICEFRLAGTRTSLSTVGPTSPRNSQLSCAFLCPCPRRCSQQPGFRCESTQPVMREPMPHWTHSLKTAVSRRTLRRGDCLCRWRDEGPGFWIRGLGARSVLGVSVSYPAPDKHELLGRLPLPRQRPCYHV